METKELLRLTLFCVVFACFCVLLSAIKITYSGIWLSGSKFAYCIYEFSN